MWSQGGLEEGSIQVDLFFDFPIGSLPEPNSGREMRFSGTTIFTLKDGKIVEELGEEAGLLALQQLGLVSASS